MVALVAHDVPIVVVYTVVGIAAVVLRGREARTDATDDSRWPTFWLLVAGFMFFGAAGRSIDIISLVADATRERAREDGWYDVRRRIQLGAIALVGLAWATSILFASLRSSARRRRYLLVAVTVVALAAFVAVRSVSHHDIDALLIARSVGTVEVGTVVEWILLIGVVAAMAAVGRRESARHDGVAPPVPD